MTETNNHQLPAALDYKGIVNNLGVPFLLIKKEGHIIEANKAACDLFGYTLNELKEIGFYALITESQNTKELKPFLENKQSKGEHTGIKKNGEHFPFEFTCFNYVSKNGEEFSSYTLTDITARIKAEEQKEFEKRDKEALINSTNDQIWSVGPNFELIAANKSFIELLKKETGITYQPGDNLMCRHSYTGHFLQLWKAEFDRCMLGEPIIVNKHIQASENLPERWVELKCNPIFENGKVMGITCYCRNITERKIAEGLLQQSEAKLAEAQRLAKLGNWHHDLNSGVLTWSEELYNILA